MLHYARLCLFLKNHYAYAQGGIKCSFLCRHNSPMAKHTNESFNTMYVFFKTFNFQLF